MFDAGVALQVMSIATRLPTIHQTLAETIMSEATDAKPDPGTSRGCPSDANHDREVPGTDLLSPLTIRGVTFRNRVAMSPMCRMGLLPGTSCESKKIEFRP